MMDETGDHANPPSRPHAKTGKDSGCCHFTTSCPLQLERHQMNLLVLLMRSSNKTLVCPVQTAADALALWQGISRATGREA
jgi:hypothetical protein